MPDWLLLLPDLDTWVINRKKVCCVCYANFSQVPPWAAVVYGVVGGAACNYATKLKFVIGVDDALDIFAEHGVGGIVGNILTAFFAAYVLNHFSRIFTRLALTSHVVITLHILTVIPRFVGVG